LSSTRTLGVALRNTATAQQLFNADEGARGWDHSAMVRALEVLAFGVPPMSRGLG